MHNGIDLAPWFLIIKDLQDIPLLLCSADFPYRIVWMKERGWLCDGSVMLKGLEALIERVFGAILYVSQ
jgi:hypothetical protein